MRAEKTKSGNWRARAYLGRDENGKAIMKSITGPDRNAVRREAIRLEDEYRGGAKRGSIGDAVSSYITSRGPVLSPSTLRGYNFMSHKLQAKYKWLWVKPVNSVSDEDIQKLIDGLVDEGLAPKTVRNYYEFLSVVCAARHKSFHEVKLPQKARPNLNIPDTATVQATIKAARGTDIYVPILLAAFGPMRRSEICALKSEDIAGNVIHVHRARVPSNEGGYEYKEPKTYTSDRYLVMPESVMEELNKLEPDKDGFLIHMNPNQITDKHRRLLKKYGLPRYRFHDLRHYCASDLHARGVPDLYIQQRTGHASPEILRQVYTHTLGDQSDIQTKAILEHFNDILKDT